MNRLTLLQASCFALLLGASLPLRLASQEPQPVPIRHLQGTSHAFLVVRTESGAVLGYGELIQQARQEHVHSHLTYHFRDGSIDEDTTDFTQSHVFRLLRDHHVQHGPFFQKASDFLVEGNGNVTLRTTEKDGKQKVETGHIDLPANLSNGITGAMLINRTANEGPFHLGLIAPTGKGRLIQLAIEVEGQRDFSPVLGVRRKATVFRIHPELGGVAGVIAPVIGKQPKDIFVWILEGDIPGLVREIGQLEEGGMVVSIEPAGTTYPAADKGKH